MAFLRRRSAAPEGVIINDPALEDDALRVARDHARRGDWHPAEELLRDVGDDWDRRGHAIDVLAQATVEDAGWADQWCAERPADAGAAAVRGWGEVHRAWAMRGADWAEHTSSEAFEGFFQGLTRARGLCRRAIELGPDDPTPWVAMLWLAIGQEEPQNEFRSRWNQLTARDPHNRLGHIAALQYLAEKWHGSHEQMYAFAREATGPWAVVLPLQAHAEYVLTEVGKGFKHAYKVADFWKDSPEVKADLDAALAWLGGSGPGHAMALHDLTVVGYALAQAERWADARELFSHMGNRAYEYPWYYQGDPLKAFTRALRKAY